MKPVIRRLRLLEQAWRVTDEGEDENGSAAIVRARRMRRLQMEGITPEARPPVQYPRGTTVADILRQGRMRAYSRNREAVL